MWRYLLTFKDNNVIFALPRPFLHLKSASTLPADVAEGECLSNVKRGVQINDLVPVRGISVETKHADGILEE